jgi:hypothetical protein
MATHHNITWVPDQRYKPLPLITGQYIPDQVVISGAFCTERRFVRQAFLVMKQTHFFFYVV